MSGKCRCESRANYTTWRAFLPPKAHLWHLPPEPGADDAPRWYHHSRGRYWPPRESLELDGIVHRETSPEIPLHVEYALTGFDVSLGSIMVQMQK
jgi:hypothetical protein